MKDFKNYFRGRGTGTEEVYKDEGTALGRVHPSDVLLSVGSRNITDYADAANAFFYLIPAQAVWVKLKRGNNPIELTITPTRPQPE